MGDFSGFFISHIAGLQINPYGDSERCVNIVPTFIPQLEYAHAFYDTVCGRVDVNWKRNGEQIILTVTKPDGIYGDVILPDGYKMCSKTNEEDFRMMGRAEYKVENAIYEVVRK